MGELLDPKEIEVEGASGVKRKFIISKLPYLSGGRELCTQYISTAMPGKVGDYKLNEELAKKAFSFVEAFRSDGTTIRLVTSELVNNHVPDFLTGIKIEAALLEHNLGFSVAEKISGFLDIMSRSIESSLTKILTASKEQSLTAEKQPSTNSEPSTASRM